MTSVPAADAARRVVPPLTPTVTLDVWRLRPVDVLRAMTATPTWGRRAARHDATFARLLGTSGSRFTAGATDLSRWVSLTVRTPAGSTDHDAPEPAWARHAVDHFRARLVPLHARGAWGGKAPFRPVDRVTGATWEGEVLALTRARLRARRVATFWRAVPPVALALADTDGLRATMGMGEAPVGFQGTLSLWRDAAAVSAFAWRDPAHRAVVDRTPREHWYAEELFARFAVVERTASLAAWADRDAGRTT